MSCNYETAGEASRRVVIRADADSRTGYGHFVRSSALMAILRDQFRVHMVSFNADTAACGKEEFDKDFLEMLAPGDIAVLDNYYHTTGYQNAVRSRCGSLVLIDDMHLHHTPADVVLTFCPLRREDFSLEPYTRFYGGIEWAFLREPFLEPIPVRERPWPPRRVMLAMGGADPFLLTGKTARSVRAVWPEATIDIVAGKNVADSEFSGNKGIGLHRDLDAAGMARLLDNADLAVLPASTVCVEAFARHTPVAGGYFIDNQRSFYDHCERMRLFTPLGCLLDPEEEMTRRFQAIATSGVVPSPDIDFTSRRKEIIGIFKSL